ncbi:hypothetical protein V6N11_030940 [Hibiscus sabdariffa]|uniref:Uncharacterized protein n=1 Tax=Hibiscus sabdariffa TaxID=183260 RepID=A0ABR2NRW5_9ROSI
MRWYCKDGHAFSQRRSFCPSIQGLPSFILIVDIFATGFTIPKALVNTRSVINLTKVERLPEVADRRALASKNVLSGPREKESLGSDVNASFLSDRTPNLASPASHRSEPLLVSLADQKAQPPQGKVAYFLDHPKTERLWHHYVQNPMIEHLV